MFQTKKMTAGALVSLMLLAAGCGGQSGASEGDGKAAADTGTKVTDKPVELVFYSLPRDSEDSFNQRFGNDLKKKFPNLTIKYVERIAGQTDLDQYVPTGQQIDIIWGSIGQWPSILGYQLQTDMTDLIKKANIDLSQFEPSLIEAMKQLSGGKIYGLPIQNSTKAIYYNKDIFDKFGVSYPKDGMTWSELYELAKKLNRDSGDNIYTGFSPSENHMVLMNEFGLGLIDPKTGKSTYGDPKWKTIIENEFLQFAKEPNYLAVSDKFRKGGIPNLNTFMKDQALAMYPETQLLPLVLPDEMSKLNWDVVAMPTYEEQKGVGYQSYPDYMSITSMCKEKDMAMEVIKYITSREFQTKLSKSGNMTSLKDPEIQKVMGQESKFKDKNYGAFFYNKFAPIGPKSELDSKVSVLGDLTGKLMGIARGNTDINTALREAQESADKKIEEAKR